MTLDDLVRAFDTATLESQITNAEELPYPAHRRAGIAAVVTALRDELREWADIEPAVYDVRSEFNRILGDAGAEK